VLSPSGGRGQGTTFRVTFPKSYPKG